MAAGSAKGLEETLRRLDQVGRLVKDRGYRQVWRFEHEGRPYYLKFYPRDGQHWKRLVRGNPAAREFDRLVRLQKAQVPAPRAIAHLVGFRLRNEVGDAVILEGIEPAVPLDDLLNDLAVRGEPTPQHRQLVSQVIELVARLSRAGLGHDDLHLGNIVLCGGKLYLLDGYAVRPGGLSQSDLFQLGHSVNRHATTADLVRGWDALGPRPGSAPPLRNPIAPRQWRKFIERTTQDNPYFGPLRVDGWSGHFFKHAKFPRRWSSVSQIRLTKDDWEQAWPALWGRIERDEFTVIKRSRSGDVLSGEIELGGRRLAVVIKRPRKRYWWRYVNEIGRGSRSRRAWRKAWELVARDIPTAWPLMYLERKPMGYVTDSLIVFERVEGPMLADVRLDELSHEGRETLFRRAGRMLRKIDRLGYSHFDAKSTNWIVQSDDKLGPRPVMVDVDGIRRYPWSGEGLRRLLRSMKHHPQYTPADSLALCQGYAPRSRLIVEDEASQAE